MDFWTGQVESGFLCEKTLTSAAQRAETPAEMVDFGRLIVARRGRPRV
jgi:hypothetical protein